MISSNKELIKLIVVLALPSLLILIYIQENVKMSLLKHQINISLHKKKELVSRNKALKAALAKLSKKSGSNYWQSYQDLIPYQNNKIVNIKLPPPID